MTISQITNHLESWAPPSYQESYDNSGLITGSPDWEVKAILITLDCTEPVVQEAMARGCNLIIAHHPIIFKGLKKLTGRTYVERTVIKAIENRIAIYAIHTNLDHVATGVNRKICEKLGLKNLKILAPKNDILSKLVTFIPQENAETVMQALYQAGAGQIGNYQNCCFQTEGTGTFMPNTQAVPHIGEANRQERVQEVRAEIIFPQHLETAVLKALRAAHPYEEVAYYLSSLRNEHQEVGAGMTGELDTPLEPIEFLKRLKSTMALQTLRHTRLLQGPIQKIAVCGGSGSFLLPQAIRSKSDIFITSDFKYHEFFDAEDRIVVADIGHYESEVYTKDLIHEELSKKFPTFAINFSETITNPISYF
jgi:dinuclear metal center YbgI/SA1388 family protein